MNALTIDRRNPEDIINYLEDRVAALQTEFRREKIRADAAEMREENLIMENEQLRREIRLLEGMTAL